MFNKYVWIVKTNRYVIRVFKNMESAKELEKRLELADINITVEKFKIH